MYIDQLSLMSVFRHAAVVLVRAIAPARVLLSPDSRIFHGVWWLYLNLNVNDRGVTMPKIIFQNMK